MSSASGPRGGPSAGTPTLGGDQSGVGTLEPLPPEIAQESVAAILENIAAARAENTRRAYRAGLRKLISWTRENHPEVVRGDVEDPVLAVLPMHPTTLAAFISEVEVPVSRGGRRTRLASTGTLSVYISAIRLAHKQAGFPDPTQNVLFEETWGGLRNRRGVQQHSMQPLRWNTLKVLVDAAEAAASAGKRPWANPRILARDRALLLVGFAGAFRRSELVSLRQGDVTLPQDPTASIELKLRRSKTSNKPARVEIPRRTDRYCPVAALLRWIDVADALDVGEANPPPGEDGDDSTTERDGRGLPLFFGFQGRRVFPKGLAASSVSKIVKRLAQEAGLAPDQIAELAAHSLRSGAATSAAEAGCGVLAIKDLGRWKSLEMVDKYVQRRQKGGDHPVATMK